MHPNIRLEAVTALGTLRRRGGLAAVQDLWTDEWPDMRAAAFRAAAAIDQESFIAVLAGMEPDRHWRVRAALAERSARSRPELATDRLRSMLQDEDKRVIPAVLSSLARLKATDLRALLLQRLADPDFVVRATAARELGTLKPEGGAEALRQAYKTALADSAYAARTAALDALAAYGAAEAASTLDAGARGQGLGRARARRGAAGEARRRATAAARTIAPAPGDPIAPYDDPQPHRADDLAARVHRDLLRARSSSSWRCSTRRRPSRNFIELARKGFFNGLEVHRVVANFVVQYGDPRGDGEGGPGYTIRDELNERPYLRGTVGMALEWRDTGGSQFFITHSPQPHLDARYTVVRPRRQRHGRRRSDQAGRRDSADSGVGRVGLGGAALRTGDEWREQARLTSGFARCTVQSTVHRR